MHLQSDVQFMLSAYRNNTIYYLSKLFHGPTSKTVLSNLLYDEQRIAQCPYNLSDYVLITVVHT